MAEEARRIEEEEARRLAAGRARRKALAAEEKVLKRRLQQLTQRVSLLLETIDAIESIKETHRLQALGTMAGGLAEELTHPLQSLHHSLQYLKEDALPDETVNVPGDVNV